VLGAADEVGRCDSLDAMCRKAVELARSLIGLERVALFLTDRARDRVVRGTWGTDLQGRSVHEGVLEHEFCELDYERLRRLPGTGAPWLAFDCAPLYALRGGRTRVVDHGWVVITPLVARQALVGVMYNDSAISHAPLDERKQVCAAVFCSLLANQILSRLCGQTARSDRPRADHSRLIRRVIDSLRSDPHLSATELAKESSVSPAQVARCFKAEVGLSFIEYRNRLRLDRFFTLVDQGGSNLLTAALEAGFGSYAQFFRVFRSMLGTTPREYLAGTAPADDAELECSDTGPERARAYAAALPDDGAVRGKARR
jgi:AraC-like DNA-binding protein